MDCGKAQLKENGAKIHYNILVGIIEIFQKKIIKKSKIIEKRGRKYTLNFREFYADERTFISSFNTT